MSNFPSDRNQIAQSVLNAFLGVGFSPAQARALTAEINRENSMRPDLLFGTHSDPYNRVQNVGMLSWQGSRNRRFMDWMRQHGQLDAQGRIPRTQDALNAQAAYLRWEMENDPSYARTREQFLGNPNIGYDDAHAVLGDNFIRWRRNDPVYRSSGYGRIDEAYRMLGNAPTAAPGFTSSGAAPAGPEGAGFGRGTGNMPPEFAAMLGSSGVGGFAGAAPGPPQGFGSFGAGGMPGGFAVPHIAGGLGHAPMPPGMNPLGGQSEGRRADFMDLMALTDEAERRQQYERAKRPPMLPALDELTARRPRA